MTRLVFSLLILILKDMAVKIERVQRKFVKFYCNKFGIAYQSENYESMCTKLGLKTLAARRIMLDLTFLHKVVNGGTDCIELLQELQFRVPSTTRNRDVFYVPSCRVNVRKNSPLIRLVREFNAISKDDDILDLAMKPTIYKNTVYRMLEH